MMTFIFHCALDLSKRHSGIVWGPGQFAGSFRCENLRWLGNPSPAPYLMGGVQARPPSASRPGDGWSYPTNCPVRRSPSGRHVTSYAAGVF